ncbi:MULTISPECIES: ABC transporter ATP-binding protein [Nocardiopsidaceae]|uniref:ABC transporter ATP-binding protein n=2 Tax=Nocardiopsidaceae TaxID=83676 RepID=A0ABY6YWH9_9ACTN|nr:ABC transporter ATP-binding protein [Streptomonospora nanhaiensis]MEE2045165.1 ABC transporter ATP-binding protein [Nocardiopsis tropica]WAE76513.1 ABC transporter ATP-binding protein [Streptomonospora nanhaiensis]
MLWSFVHPHRRKLALGLVLALLGSALELANPMVIKLVLDTVADAGSLVVPISLLLGLFALGIGFGLWHWILLGTVAEKVVLDARTSLVRRYFRAALIPMSRRPSGELVTRATSDTVLLREAASSSIISLVNGGVLLVGTLVMMGVLDLVLLAVTFTAVLVVTILFLTLMPAIAKAQEKAQNSLGLMGGVLDGALRAVRTVKVSRAEDRLGGQILEHARQAAHHGVRSVRREAVAWTIAYGGIQISIIAILGVGALRVTSGAMEVSSLIAFLLYAFTLMNPVMELSQSVTTLQSGVAAARRIREVEAIPLEPSSDGPDVPLADPDGAGDALLELRGVTARYAPGAEAALDRVDLSIPRRGHTAIVGPSGAGKTTVFSLLLRFLEPVEGELALAGTPYPSLTPRQVRGHFAYVEQDTPVIPGTVRENLLFSRPDASEEDVRRVLDEVGLADKVDALEEGLDTQLDATSFSGGQRQRIALARALLCSPDVLLLDEATSQVDAITEAAITESLRRHADRKAVVTIAHRLSTVIHADSIVLMEDGRVRSRGTHRELLDRDPLYRELVAALHISEAGDGGVLDEGLPVGSS